MSCRSGLHYLGPFFSVKSDTEKGLIKHLEKTIIQHRIPPTSAKIWNLLGKLLVLVSLCFIGVLFWDKRRELISLDYSGALVGVFISAILVYGVAGFLLSKAWCIILSRLARKSFPTGWCHAVYGRTQISKYIPGNIFHLAGRHLVGKHPAIDHKILLVSTIYEILLLIISSSILALVGLFLIQVDVQASSATFSWSLLIFIIGLVISVFMIAPYIARKGGVILPIKGVVDHIRILWPCAALYGLFFLIAGSVLTALVIILGSEPISFQIFGNVIIIFVCSWIGGFITPGAPGGIGVRETITILSLAGTIGQSQAIMVALLFRLITVLGDILFYLLSLIYSPADHE